MTKMRLIDADALPVHRVKILHPDGIYDGEVVFPEHIANATTIEAKPVRKGRWEYGNAYCVCSECGEIPECFEPNYCPNCGAKMDGGTEA